MAEEQMNGNQGGRWGWLYARFRLVLMHEETFEEARSFRVTPMALIVAAALTLLGVGLISAALVAFSPLRYYVPGYGAASSQRGDLVMLYTRLDSIESSMVEKDLYIERLRQRVLGEMTFAKDVEKNVADGEEAEAAPPIPNQSDATRDLVDAVEREKELGMLVSSNFASNSDLENIQLLSPLRGVVSDTFAPKRNHYGIDIVAAKGSVIKSVMKGTVILSTWSAETGHVIGLQHEDNLLSFYKHNSSLFKKEGDFVKAGEAIAVIGNSGEMTNGPHLHFELWYKGQAVDPKSYIAF